MCDCVRLKGRCPNPNVAPHQMFAHQMQESERESKNEYEKSSSRIRERIRERIKE